MKWEKFYLMIVGILRVFYYNGIIQTCMDEYEIQIEYNLYNFRLEYSDNDFVNNIFQKYLTYEIRGFFKMDIIY